jgi:hypothetical protein
MSTVVTKFEVHLPISATSQTAVNSFLDTLGAIVPFQQTIISEYTGSTGAPTQRSAIYGLLTALQAVSAGTALTTLNAALVISGDGPVTCFTENVTLQP